MYEITKSHECFLNGLIIHSQIKFSQIAWNSQKFSRKHFLLYSSYVKLVIRDYIRHNSANTDESVFVSVFKSI